MSHRGFADLPSYEAVWVDGREDERREDEGREAEGWEDRRLGDGVEEEGPEAAGWEAESREGDRHEDEGRAAEGAAALRGPRFKRPPPMHGDPTAWFLGPRGENFELFSALISEAMKSNEFFRTKLHPNDSTVITDEAKERDAYKDGVGSIHRALGRLLIDLREHATPYYSWRYQGHMLWDTTIPSLVGYFATMLHNPNNVTVQASTLTTLLEQHVGWDLCAMLGFPFGAPAPDPHGHLTSGGTVANVEATWSARELRYFPLVVKDALTEKGGPMFWLAGKERISVSYRGQVRSIVDLSEWELLNLRQDDILGLPRQIFCLGPPRVPGGRTQPRWTERVVWELLLKDSMNALGVMGFHHRFLSDADLPPIGPPVVLAPVSKHYSWPKAMALLGGGADRSSMMDVKVDEHGRMDTTDLRRQLHRARAAWRPTLLVVAVAGSTEESSVDDIGEILRIRDEFRADGYEFNLHVDAAWGGYFLSTLRKDFDDPGEHDRDESTKFFDPADWTYEPSDNGDGRYTVAPRNDLPEAGDELVPGRNVPAYPSFLSDHVVDAFLAIAKADSATIDPHKTGYTPYPAGAICYRNGEMRRLVTFGAPVIGSGQNATSVGEFGIEGSKPGAAAASVYLSHAVIRPSHSGHGRLVDASMLNAKLFWMELIALNRNNPDFIAVPLADPTGCLPTRTGPNPRPDWFEKGHDAALEETLERFKELEEALVEHRPEHPDPSESAASAASGATSAYDRAYLEARGLGPDLNIVDYMFNFRWKEAREVNGRPVKKGEVNRDLRLLNRFNLAIYNRLHVVTKRIDGTRIDPDRVVGNIANLPVIISKTEVWRSTYGDHFVLPFLGRLGVDEIGPGGENVRAVLEMMPKAPSAQSGEDDLRESEELWLDCYRKLAVLRSVIMDPFLHTKDLRGDFYLHEWMRIVRGEVSDVAAQFQDVDPTDHGDCGD